MSSVKIDRQTEGQTESDAYEPTVQYAQVGSISGVFHNFQKDRQLEGQNSYTLSNLVSFYRPHSLAKQGDNVQCTW